MYEVKAGDILLLERQSYSSDGIKYKARQVLEVTPNYIILEGKGHKAEAMEWRIFEGILGLLIKKENTTVL